MYGLKLFICGDEPRHIKTETTTIAATNKTWRMKNPKFFHCDTLPRQTVSSAIRNF